MKPWKYARNTYAFEFEVRAAKRISETDQDSDGVVEGEYAFRLIPEDAECEGILIERSVVSVEESFDTAEGKKWNIQLMYWNLTKAIRWNLTHLLLKQVSLFLLTKSASAGHGALLYKYIAMSFNKEMIKYIWCYYWETYSF